ncbi:hypothetical protein [Mycobacterium sp.]|uniref:hypothetical protein n=1 Tax=Mycobacterium sp. TaxID=1785 RepID=UPI003C70D8D5
MNGEANFGIAGLLDALLATHREHDRWRQFSLTKATIGTGGKHTPMSVTDTESAACDIPESASFSSTRTSSMFRTRIVKASTC